MDRTELRNLVEMATEALGRYRLRTSLSVLGVVLGVASVIAMLSVSEGAGREALAQVNALGLDNIVVRSRPQPGLGMTRPLHAGDASGLVALVPQVASAASIVDRQLIVQQGGTSALAHVLGVEPAWQSITRAGVARGRLLTPLDETSGARVCVLGAALARRLFRYRDPLGASIRLGDDYAEVVGVLVASGSSARPGTTLAWRDRDDVALMPLSTLAGRNTSLAPDLQVDEVWLALGDGDRAQSLAPIIAHALDRFGGGRDADLVVPRELLAQRQRTQRTFAVIVGSVAVLALLVGGIGIMNIMLTSVIERTREIGIRRTAGATRRDVARQFLAEALLMTMAGGLVGIAVGSLVAAAITAFASWTTYVSPSAILLGFVVSCLVGLAFGTYPALQAARLEPVDAMRYE